MKLVPFLALVLLLTAPSARACVTAADCDDHNLCNGTESCQAGVCIPGTGITCDDGNPCTIDTCDPVAGCTFTPANGCLLAGKKFRLGTGRDLRLGLQTAPQMSGVAFPANNTADDPVINGASLRVFATSGDLFDNTYPMPMHNWSYIGAQGENRGYLYKDFHNLDGPINIVLIRDGKKNKIKARGAALNFSLHEDPEPVWIVLRFGNTGRLFCLEFGGRTKFYRDIRFAGVASPAPASCP